MLTTTRKKIHKKLINYITVAVSKNISLLELNQFNFVVFFFVLEFNRTNFYLEDGIAEEIYSDGCVFEPHS